MRKAIAHEFVEYVPDELEDGTIYVSIQYSTAVHRCCCGCGREVVTPLAPDEWERSYDGASVSLSPSVGNWSFPCSSHYWITRGKVQWAPRWSQERIEAARKGQQWNWEDSHEIAEGERAEAPSIRRGGLRERLRRLFSQSRV